MCYFWYTNLWNFYVKYYKTFIQKLRKNVKRYYPIVSGTCSHHVISFTSSHFGVSSLFCHTQRTLCQNPRIIKFWRKILGKLSKTCRNSGKKMRKTSQDLSETLPWSLITYSSSIQFFDTSAPRGCRISILKMMTAYSLTKKNCQILDPTLRSYNF